MQMTMFEHILPRMGITCTFVDPNDPQNFVGDWVNGKTRAFYCETCANPSLDIADLDAISQLAHENGVPLIVDDTFTTAYLQRPFDHGADIVVTSLTKWTGGHGTAIGGMIIDGGTFDWTAGKHPLYDEEDGSYNNLRWGHDLPETLAPIAFILRLRTVLLRNTGACISPDNAWMFLQGIETLPLRMEKHCANSLAVAEYLNGHECVEWVRYPGLAHDKNYDLNQQYLGGKGGSMVVFGVKGGREASARFINSLGLVSHVANVGDAKTLAINPATTTHSQMTEEQLVAAGIPPELVRLSIGIEHIDDILADMEQALLAAVTEPEVGAPKVRFDGAASGLRENRKIPMFPREATIRGRLFHYNIFGQITTSGMAQPPLIAIGGWGMVQEEWGKLPYELSGTRDVLTFDNQGIGGSIDEADDEFSLESWCDDIVDLAEEAFGPGVTFSVMGFSLGAFAAQHLAVTRPERVVSVVLIGGQGARDSAVAGAGKFFGLASKTMATDRNTLEDNDARLRYFFTEELIAEETPEDWAAVVAQNMRFKRPSATIKKQLGVLGSADVDLSAISQPTLVMFGEHDPIVPAGNGSLVMEQLTNAARKELVIMAGQAHMCWGICPPRKQLKFQARDTAMATHIASRHIQDFLGGGTGTAAKL
jgi:O-acetylhomoserine (thiol)-lyase